MQKIATFLRRVRTMSLGRMLRYARIASRESGRPVLLILPDMVYCAFRYGVGYLDYHTFGFAHIRDRASRLTFMTMNDNLALVRRLNSSEDRRLFEDKLQFDRAFSDMIGRDFLGLANCSEQELLRFAGGKGRVFVKTLDGFGGLGVRCLEAAGPEELAARLRELAKQGYGLAEEAITQHPRMDLLCKSSVNTVRMVTLLNSSGQPHLIYSLVRMGMGTAPVDNISSGGMYSSLDPEGRIVAPAYCDKTGESYPKHPATGQQLTGFEIPFFPEARELVLRAALRYPRVRYVGWDVAITSDGPVLVEGNTIPGYDMCQNYRHNPSHRGILPLFEKVLGEELRLR